MELPPESMSVAGVRFFSVHHLIAAKENMTSPNFPVCENSPSSQCHSPLLKCIWKMGENECLREHLVIAERVALTQSIEAYLMMKLMSSAAECGGGFASVDTIRSAVVGPSKARSCPGRFLIVPS